MVNLILQHKMTFCAPNFVATVWGSPFPVPAWQCAAKAYCYSIKLHSVLPTLWQQFGEGPFLFQHDIDPVHKARLIQKWFVEIGVEELDLPAQSPDLNPIEHLLNELECWLWARPNRPSSMANLTDAPVAEWKQVAAAMFQHLVESLPRRVEAVIAKGGATPY